MEPLRLGFRLPGMTHYIRLPMIRTAASIGLAIAMLYAGPVLGSFHKGPAAQVAHLQDTNVTVAHKTFCVPTTCHDAKSTATSNPI